MSLPRSRPPSATTPDSKDSPEVTTTESKRKIYLDSGFDEAPYSTPTPSTSGKNSHHTHQHRSRRRVGESESAVSSGRGRQTLHKGRHDSINSTYSDNLDYKNYGNQSDNCSSKSGTSSISSSIGDRSEEATCSSRDTNKTEVRYSPQPLAPPPTSDGTVETRESKREYDFPSDTELSEIIAIMSGLATPRKQKQRDHFLITNSAVSAVPSDHSFPPFYDENKSLEQIENNDKDLSQPSNRITNNIPLYEKHNHNNVANGFVINGKVTNVDEGRKYFQKGSKSLDRGTSDNNSISDSLRDSNRQKSQNSLNSLSSILTASRNGQIGSNKKKPKQAGKKPRKPPPPKKEDLIVEEYGTKLSWKQRLKFFLTLVASVVLIVSSSSLLFIVPIIVDPILVGLEAHFSPLPAQCRTVSKRNGSGSDECTVPSCREGCTADLLSCYFIEVEYQHNTTANSSLNSYEGYNRTVAHRQEQHRNPSQEERKNETSISISTNIMQLESFKSMEASASQHLPSQGSLQEGILLINPSGCGFPPEINCSTFERQYGEIGNVFPCFYSTQNTSIVVPLYNRSEEIYVLAFYLIIPCGSTLLCSALLYFLLRWNPKPKRNKIEKVKEKLSDLSATERILSSNNRGSKSRTVLTEEEEGMKLNILGSTQPVTIGNGTLSNIVGDLTGITANNVMKKRHYKKFSTSISNPNSEENSRKASISSLLAVGSLEMENTKSNQVNQAKDTYNLLSKHGESIELHEQSHDLLMRTISFGNHHNYNNFNEYSEKSYEKHHTDFLSSSGYPPIPEQSSPKFNKSNNNISSAHNSINTTSQDSKAPETSLSNGNHFAWNAENSNPAKVSNVYEAELLKKN